MLDLNITATQYIEAAFPPDLLNARETPLISYPAEPFTDENGLPVYWHKHQAASPRLLRKVDREVTDSSEGEGWLFCVSAVQPTAEGKVKARLQDVRTAFVFPLDDIGTKSKQPAVRPSVILETSKDNYQWHYFIQPFDVSTAKGQAYYDACLVATAKAGINDPGVRAASRLVKFPNAVHKSGFITRVVEWSPGRSWDLPELMAELGVEVIEGAGRKFKGAAAPGAHSDLADVEDGLWDWMQENWEIRSGGSHWIGVKCPWESEHSTGAGSPTSTGYSPKDYDSANREFSCLHAGCKEKRDTAQFLEIMRRKGAAWRT